MYNWYERFISWQLFQELVEKLSLEESGEILLQCLGQNSSVIDALIDASISAINASKPFAPFSPSWLNVGNLQILLEFSCPNKRTLNIRLFMMFFISYLNTIFCYDIMVSTGFLFFYLTTRYHYYNITNNYHNYCPYFTALPTQKMISSILIFLILLLISLFCE